MQVKDKVIVVTGAASGIGKALCERFAMEGASAIVATDINSQGLSATVSDISNRSQTLGITCDVGKEEEASELVEKTLAAFGHIDLFCSNAGHLGYQCNVSCLCSTGRVTWNVRER